MIPDTLYFDPEKMDAVYRLFFNKNFISFAISICF